MRVLTAQLKCIPLAGPAHLCQPDHEEVLRLLVVELGQVAQEPCKASVVGARTYYPHGNDGVAGDGGIAVVGELAEHVEDGQLRVRRGEQGQG